MFFKIKLYFKKFVLYLALLFVRPLIMFGLIEQDLALLGQIFETVLQPLNTKIDVLNERLTDIEKIVNEAKKLSPDKFKDKANINIQQPDNQPWAWQEKCRSFQEKSGDVSTDSIKTENHQNELHKEDLISLGDITVCPEEQIEIYSNPRTQSRMSEPGSLDAELNLHEQDLHDFVNKYSSSSTPSPSEVSKEGSRDSLRKVKFKKGLRSNPKSSLTTVSSLYHSSGNSKILNKDNSFDSLEPGELRELITSSSSEHQCDPFEDCSNAPLFKILKNRVKQAPQDKSRDDVSFRSLSPGPVKDEMMTFIDVDTDSNLSTSYNSLVEAKYSLPDEHTSPDSTKSVPYIKRKDLEFGVLCFDNNPKTSIPKTPRTLPKINPKLSPRVDTKEKKLTKPKNDKLHNKDDEPPNKELITQTSEIRKSPHKPSSIKPLKVNKLSRSRHYSSAKDNPIPPVILKPDYNILVGDEEDYTISDSCNEDIKPDQDYMTDELASTGESIRTIQQSPLSLTPRLAVTEEFNFFLQNPLNTCETEEKIPPEVIIDHPELSHIGSSKELPTILERNSSSDSSSHLKLIDTPMQNMTCASKRSLFKHSKYKSQHQEDGISAITSTLASFTEESSNDSFVTDSSLEKVTHLDDAFTPSTSFQLESFERDPVPAEEIVEVPLDIGEGEVEVKKTEVKYKEQEENILEYTAPSEVTFYPNLEQPFGENYEIPVNSEPLHDEKRFQDEFNSILSSNLGFEDDAPIETQLREEVRKSGLEYAAPNKGALPVKHIYHDIEPRLPVTHRQDQLLPHNQGDVQFNSTELFNRDPIGLQRVNSLRSLPVKKKRTRRLSVQNIIQRIETTTSPPKNEEKESKSIFSKFSLRKKKDKNRDNHSVHGIERPESCPPIEKSTSSDSLLKTSHKEVLVNSSSLVVQSGSVSELPIHKPPPGLVKKMKNKIGRSLSFKDKPNKAFSEADISSISPKEKKKRMFRNKSPKFWKSPKTGYSSLQNERKDYKDTDSLVSQDSFEFAECLDSGEDDDLNVRSYQSAQTNSEISNWANFEEAFQSRENLPALSRSESKKSVLSLASITGKPPPSPHPSIKRKSSLKKDKSENRVPVYAPAVMPAQTVIKKPSHVTMAYKAPTDITEAAPFVIEAYNPPNYVTEVISSAASTTTDNEQVEYHTEQYDFTSKDQLCFGSTKADITICPWPSPQVEGMDTKIDKVIERFPVLEASPRDVLQEVEVSGQDMNSTFSEYARPVSIQQIVKTFESEFFEGKIQDFAEEVNTNTELQKALLDIVQQERKSIRLQREASFDSLRDIKSKPRIIEGHAPSAKQQTKKAILKLLEDAKSSINIDLACLEDLEELNQLTNSNMIDGLLALVENKKHHGPRKLFLCTFISHLIQDMEMMDSVKIKRAHRETLKQFKTTSDAIEELDETCASVIADRQDMMVKSLIDSLLSSTFSKIRHERKQQKYKNIIIRELLRKHFSMKLKMFKDKKFLTSVLIRDMLRCYLETKLSEIRLDKPSNFTRKSTKVFKNKTRKIEEFRNNFVIKMCLSNMFSTMSKRYRRRTTNKKYHFQHLCQSMLANIITESQFSELVTCTIQDCLSKYLFLKLESIRQRPYKGTHSPVKLLPFFKHKYEGRTETVERFCYSPIPEIFVVETRPESALSSRSETHDNYCQTDHAYNEQTYDTDSMIALGIQSSFESVHTKECASSQTDIIPGDLETTPAVSLTSILTQTDFGINPDEFQPFKHTRALLSSRKSRSRSVDSALGDDSIVSDLSLEKRGDEQKDVHIPKSPFTINVRTPFDPSSVLATGPGLMYGMVGKVSLFEVDCRAAGSAPLNINVEDDDQNLIPVRVVETQPNCYDVSFVPHVAIPHFVNVLWNDFNIRGSPFKINVLERPEKDINLGGEGKIRVYYSTTTSSEKIRHNCRFLQSLLERKKVHLRPDFEPWIPIDIGMDREERNKIFEKAECRKTPMLFIDDQYVGGYDEVMELDEIGEMDRLLSYCTLKYRNLQTIEEARKEDELHRRAEQRESL